MKRLKSTLPVWAQEMIAKNTSFVTTSSRPDGSLRIVGEDITFDGAEVVESLDEPQERTISIHDVPDTIKRIIINTPLGHTVQSTVVGRYLRIEADGTAIYNGQTVLNSTVIEEQQS